MKVLQLEINDLTKRVENSNKHEIAVHCKYVYYVLQRTLKIILIYQKYQNAFSLRD